MQTFEHGINFPLRKNSESEFSIPPELASIYRVETIDNSTISFKKFLSNFKKSIYTELDVLKSGEKSKSELTRHVIAFIGAPGAGKSFCRSRVATWVQETFSEASFQSLTWEKDGEGENRPQDRSSTYEEIIEANANFAGNVIRSLDDHDVTCIECPAIATLRRDHTWIGRPLGSPTLLTLAKKSSLFFSEDEKMEEGVDINALPPTKLYVVSLLGGPLLKRMMIPMRDGIRRAKNLEEAQEICKLFNKPVPQNQDEWRRISQDGASVSQSKYIEQLVEQAIAILAKEESFGSSISPPLFSHFEQAYEERAEKMMRVLPGSKESILWDMYSILVSAYFQKHIIQKTLRVSPYEVFIGTNDPSLEDLGILPENYGRIKEFLSNMQ